ncbi:MAG: bifunctional phosphopantothenoylcysteine decarboxylase/phosphopantothenate--cysteine ligase CoaBC [Cellvibrionales bacterium]|nr:bifunctional phosphopantothenoylcysteine decarboxylase/phosphopantothenate--cysteine ligase CoaBC [Cellvibrionales bacterium]HCH20404.1 bifunctional phosphopantothenoylcysteine decarboxylase/phosphopantothenate--cysteine ligase CoaBC [Cellvibrionales bacterium]
MKQTLQNKRLLLGITGGIAAYKSPEVVRRLRDAGAEVRVVMTRGAMEFITPLTLQAVSSNRVHSDLLDADAEAAMGHIELARWADAIIVAPVTADALARFAQGRADDLLTTLLRASDAPVLLAPAMNQAMWRDAATQENSQILSQRGYRLVGPDDGAQACGDIGAGRMSEPLAIVAAASDLFEQQTLTGQHVVITAGPTRERIDPVRYLSNFSTGKMGFALAEAAAEAGAKVTLIAGPVSLSTPDRVERIDVISADQMLAAAQQFAAPASIFIAAAAVADFRPSAAAEQKIKKTSDIETMQLDLVKNPDILKSVAESDRSLFSVGFAAETENLLAHARAKLARKSLNMIVVNDVSRSDIGFAADDNEVVVITPKDAIKLEKANKRHLSRRLIQLIAEQVSPADNSDNG